MASLLVSALSRLTGNVVMQTLLQRNVILSQQLMGIGTGAGVWGSGERAILKATRRHCESPFCVFDVGANQGQFLKLASAELAGADYAIHCFEPGAEAFKSLKTVSHSQSVHLNNVGIGKEPGESTLFYDQPGSTMASMTKRNLDHRGIEFDHCETIHTETIDRYCAQNNIDHISLLKIDIEGHEMDALIGAERMLQQRAIDLISFEFGGTHIDTRTPFRDFWFLLQEHGIEVFRITPSGYFSKIRRYKETLEQYRTTNFIGIRYK